jgi:chromosome segregation ATPase
LEVKVAASDAKLEGLRKMAADERTPIEEARSAALAFVRAGGGLLRAGATPEEVTQLRGAVAALEAEVQAHRQNAKERLLQQRAERERTQRAQRERDEARAELSQLAAALQTVLKYAAPRRPEAEQARAYLSTVWGDVFGNTPFGKKP